MNEIKIKGLNVFGYHGVLEEEKTLGQKFIIDASLKFNTQVAGYSDEVKDTMHYGHVTRDIEKVVSETRFDLIESCLEAINQMLFETYPIIGVKIDLYKPWAPVHRNIEMVSVHSDYTKKRVFIALGSNIGDTTGYLNFAIDKISKLPLTKVIKESARIVTKPYGNVKQEDFLNSVVMIETMLLPQTLLNELQKIEKEAKREREIKWGPRTLDLDIILYGNEIIDEENLIVPHPGLELRSFVLAPLVELHPYVRNPFTGKFYKEYLGELDD